jgi:hypothetical protein
MITKLDYFIAPGIEIYRQQSSFGDRYDIYVNDEDRRTTNEKIALEIANKVVGFL